MDALRDLLKQTEEWPASVLVVVVLNFIGSAMKRSGHIPNNHIPSVLMLLGAIFYIFVGDVGSINFKTRYPVVTLALYGLLLGAIAWMFHSIIWRSIEKKLPQLRNGSGDTEIIHKPKEPPSPSI